ncbi:hypothetical protein AMTRI_Chr01g135680 [Amborella trichopoda]|uniref:GATA-type domain-containing protein n=1 Tax=Amborella trichopoda TaxID=13333 RepID=W1PXK4_AMBTC|nr:GATA zinc finger domain-containing protein 8 [Amborella trichopoda]ERN12699.1 hypothetical protein AMTR_s00025p00250380 [Amborella trichopoda]|eukprot:XP_006851118.1 GATA zinc finger domain-containing protein 8 [Amborella trichopoda]
MIQGAALRAPTPVYGHSHFKKFWLKKKEIEDAEERLRVVSAQRPKPSYSSIEHSSLTKSVRFSMGKSELDYAFSLSSDNSSDNGASDRKKKEEEETGDLSSISPRTPTPVNACADCKTVKTPLWRNGPLGPKSLCNACGIRYKKLGKKVNASNGSPRGIKRKDEVEAVEDKFWKRRPFLPKKGRVIDRDEKEGAMLLMALSCGLVAPP